MATSFAKAINNIATTVAAPYTAGSGSLTVASAAGITLSGGEWIRVSTFRSGTPISILKATAVSGNILTIAGVASNENPALGDNNLIVGDAAEMRVTGGELVDIHTAINTLENASPVVSSVFSRTGAVVATSGDYSVGQVTGAAPIASPSFTGSTLTLADAQNIVVGTTTGTKIGTATTQKLGFFNTAPVAQPTGDALTALSNLGLIASPTLSEADVTNLTTDLAAKAPIATPSFTGSTLTLADAQNIVVGTTTGTKIGTATTQKLGFFNQAPVAQPSGDLLTALGTSSGLGLVASPTISEADVTNLTTDLSAKATDSLVVHLAGIETITGAKTFNADVTHSDAKNIVVGTTTGTKIGTATTQKLGFFNQAPVVQPSGDILTALGTSSGLGLIASPTISEGDVTNLTTDLAAKAPIATPSFTGSTLTLADAQNIVIGSTTGTKIGTATTQKLGFFNQAPVVQPSGDLLTALGTSSGLGLVASPTISEADVTNLTTDLSAKATDSLVVHLAGTESITGAKTFSLSPTIPTPADGDNTTKAASTAYALRAAMIFNPGLTTLCGAL